MKEIKKVEIRHHILEDYLELKDSMISSYDDMQGAYWKEHHIKNLPDWFPEWQIAVLADDKVVGCSTTSPYIPIIQVKR